MEQEFNYDIIRKINGVIENFKEYSIKISHIYYHEKLIKVINTNKITWEEISKYIIMCNNISENEIFILFYIGFSSSPFLGEHTIEYRKLSDIFDGDTTRKLYKGFNNYLNNDIEELSIDNKDICINNTIDYIDYKYFSTTYSYLYYENFQYPIVNVMGYLSFCNIDYFMDLIKTRSRMKSIYYFFGGAVDLKFTDENLLNMMNSSQLEILCCIDYYYSYNLDIEINMDNKNNISKWYNRIETGYKSYPHKRIEFMLKYIFHYNKIPQYFYSEVTSDNVSRITIEFLNNKNLVGGKDISRFFEIVKIMNKEELIPKAKQLFIKCINLDYHLFGKIDVEYFSNICIDCFNDEVNIQIKNELVKIYSNLKISEFDEQLRRSNYFDDVEKSKIIIKLFNLLGWDESFLQLK